MITQFCSEQANGKFDQYLLCFDKLGQLWYILPTYFLINANLVTIQGVAAEKNVWSPKTIWQIGFIVYQIIFKST
jgi:hypothetical protein